MDKFVKQNQKTVDSIIALENIYESMSDEELKSQTDMLRQRILNEPKNLNDIRIHAFAVMREATNRVLNMKQFPVQLMGGLVLDAGNIAEMKTGEGKTIVSLCPAYFNALQGKKTYIVTVNDYLAERDSQLNGQVYDFLGITSGVILNEMKTPERRRVYQKDVIYITNSELGFDFLRNNMANTVEDQIQAPLDFCIIDEADSVLIDEARTPLIISGGGKSPIEIYEEVNTFVTQLERGEESEEFSKSGAIFGNEIEETGDFIVHMKEKYVTITAQGVQKAEDFFHLTNFADPRNVKLRHMIENSLYANYVLQKDGDYIVRDGEVLIVDANTGRVMQGRRFSDGVHQAIEAKEHVEIKPENVTLASITYQNFFNKFKKKSGMTGTAKTDEREFRDVYNMPVVCIPTNKPVARIDHPDVMFLTRDEKNAAIVKDAANSYKKGQPVLIGTKTIKDSETLSHLLAEAGVPHFVLNAKNHAYEATIVKDAGKEKAVTIATNMAGRGTDIKLSYKAIQAGGLKVIGDGRNDSRRIDDQLIGRAGRQGDVGESIYYNSLEDDLIKYYNPDAVAKYTKLIKSLNADNNEEIDISTLNKLITKAQKNVEALHFGTREDLLKYDTVNDKQMSQIYNRRNDVLRNDIDSNYQIISTMIKEYVIQLVEDCYKKKNHNASELINAYYNVFPIEEGMRMTEEEIKKSKKKALIDILQNEATEFYDKKRNDEDTGSIQRNLEKNIMLKMIDKNWTAELANLESLKDGISFQSYAQHDPTVMYNLKANKLYRGMMDNIRRDTLKQLTHVQIIVPEKEVPLANQKPRLSSSVRSVNSEALQNIANKMHQDFNSKTE